MPVEFRRIVIYKNPHAKLFEDKRGARIYHSAVNNTTGRIYTIEKINPNKVFKKTQKQSPRDFEIKKGWWVYLRSDIKDNDWPVAILDTLGDAKKLIYMTEDMIEKQEEERKLIHNKK